MGVHCGGGGGGGQARWQVRRAKCGGAGAQRATKAGQQARRLFTAAGLTAEPSAFLMKPALQLSQTAREVGQPTAGSALQLGTVQASTTHCGSRGDMGQRAVGAGGIHRHRVWRRSTQLSRLLLLARQALAGTHHASLQDPKV